MCRKNVPNYDKLTKLLTPVAAGDRLTLKVDAPTLMTARFMRTGRWRTH